MNRSNRQRLAASAVVALALLLATIPAAAQEAELRIDSAETSAYPVVEMSVTVRGGGPVQGFSVVEGDGEPISATLEKLTAESLQVVLALDTSGSMKGEPLVAAQDAARSFVEALPAGVEIAVLGFGSSPALHADFTTDTATVLAAVGSLEAGGETALYDALSAASGAFPEETSRAWVVLLSDGGDTVSSASLEEAIVAVLGADVGLYVVQLASPEADFAALDRLAAAAEGTVVEAGDAGALGAIFTSIASDLSNQYRLTYTSAAHGLTDLSVITEGLGVDVVAGGNLRLPAPPPPAAFPAPTTPPPAPPTTAAPVTTLPAAPPTTTRAAPGPLATPEALAVGAGLVFLAFLGLLMLAQGSRDEVAKSARRLRRRRQSDERTGVLSGITNAATLLAERTLERNERAKSLNARLEQAGVRLRPGEFVLVAAAGAIGLLAAGTYVGGPLLGLGLAAASFAAPRLWLGWRAKRRRDAFAMQLGDTLQLIAGSIRAGYGLLQAIEAAASEALPPTSEEFSRLLVETQLGRDLGDALGALADRVDSDDFRWVVEAIEIHRQVGGDLSEILDIVSTTIRDRASIRRRIKALSAEGRLSAFILIGLPLVVGTAISFTNPGYMAELTGSVVGRFMIGGGAGLMVVGSLWMRKIVQPRF